MPNNYIKIFGDDKMRFDLEYITKYIDNKIEENDKLIKITFYELRVKEKLSEEQTQCFLRLSKQRLKNLGYRIYNSGDYYLENGEKKLIQNNIFYIALKIEKE